MSGYAYEKKYDVLIIGGGVIGCSIAHALALRSQGKMKIALLERNTVGEEASSGAAGMLAAQIESQGVGPFLDLALRSRSLFAGLAGELKDQTGIVIEHLPSGILAAAFSESQEKSLRARLGWQVKAGLACEWLSPEEVKKRFPFLKPARGGLWAPQDGQVSSNRLTAALCEAAKKLGVDVAECESFDLVDLKEPRLPFVETNLSKFVAGKFIFTAGSWTGELLKKRVPIEPVKGQILIFEMPRPWRAAHPWEAPVFFGDTPGPEPIHCYAVPKKDGHLWVGATMERRGFDKSENAASTERISQFSCEAMPVLGDFPFKGVWVGLRPGSPDGLPLLGLLPGFDNVYVAGGHFRNGILLSPITGKIFADLLVDGKPSFPIDAFSPARFAK